MNTAKTVGSVVEKLMQTLEHSTKEEDISMPMSEKLNLEFETFGESDLAKMKEKSQKWLFAQSQKSDPYWCSLLGTSGTGKTYLAKQCKNKIEQLGLNMYK